MSADETRGVCDNTNHDGEHWESTAVMGRCVNWRPIEKPAQPPSEPIRYTNFTLTIKCPTHGTPLRFIRTEADGSGVGECPDCVCGPYSVAEKPAAEPVALRNEMREIETAWRERALNEMKEITVLSMARAGMLTHHADWLATVIERFDALESVATLRQKLSESEAEVERLRSIANALADDKRRLMQPPEECA